MDVTADINKKENRRARPWACAGKVEKQRARDVENTLIAHYIGNISILKMP